MPKGGGDLWIWVIGLLGVGAAALFLKGRMNSGGGGASTAQLPPSGYTPGASSRYYSPSPHPYTPYTPPDPVNYSIQPLGSNYAPVKKGCGCNKGKISNSSSI